MAKPSKVVATKVIVTEEFERPGNHGGVVNVVLEEVTYDNAPHVTYNAKVRNVYAETEHRKVFETYSETLARLFYREYIELLKK
jgi:hypothetical protein